MAWCESQEQIYYCLGLARHERRQALLAPALARMRERTLLCGGAAVREFAEFDYRTLESWSRARRVIGQAEVSERGDNPRFVVTNLPLSGFEDEQEPGRFEPRARYETLYCGRGEMENMVKQMQLDLLADRTSTQHLASNPLRLWMSAFAYLLLERLRSLTLQGTSLARATVGTIRLRLLKVAAQITVSVRRVHVQLASAYPLKALFAQCHRRLQRLEESALAG
jgi:Transposase DDE domain group 1